MNPAGIPGGSELNVFDGKKRAPSGRSDKEGEHVDCSTG